MGKIKLETAIKEMSEFLLTLGIDGTFQYVGDDNVLIRSRQFKDNEELYDPSKREVYLKGRILHVQDINDSHYPALIFNMGELLRCKYQGGVQKEIHYIVTDVSGYDIVDEDFIVDMLDISTIDLPIVSVEVSDRYLELELDNIDELEDDIIKEKMSVVSDCYCIIDRTNSIVSISLVSFIKKMKPENDVKRVDTKIFISKN